MQRRPPAVLFVPAHVIPLRHPPSVVTIHDLGYLHHPEAHPQRDRWMLDWTTRWSTRVARRVIAISEATRCDLVQCYGVAQDKIDVIPHGVDSRFFAVDDDAIRRVRQSLALPERFVLAVGTVQPRKNLGRLAVAMRYLAASGLPHSLVVAGKRGWLASTVERDITQAGMGDRIIFLGYVPAPYLPALYAAADALAFPSLYEGFGLPVLEAMAAGTPVVAANRSAIPEVAGDAALLVDPFSPEEIARGLMRVLTEPALRAGLVARGRERAASFSWEKSALATLDVLRRVRDGTP
jgi:glycosyltransferase involved in cell wall biosynthesis